MSETRTPQSDYLLALGKRLLEPYTKLPGARAAMITGSVAEGISDHYSDLDMMVYYENELPDDETLSDILKQNGAAERVLFLGAFADHNIIEAYEIYGVQAQIQHATLAVWESEMAEVLGKFDADTPLHKAMSGMLESIPVFGENQIAAWKGKIAQYPDGLRRAMVEKHLQFFPYWNVQAQIGARDATIWHYQILTEAAYNLIAILAGLNRLYFTTFQFKKMRRLLNQMQIIPENFAERLETLFTQNQADAAVSLESLVRDVIALVEREIPDTDVQAVKKRLGARRPPWMYQELA